MIKKPIIILLGGTIVTIAAAFAFFHYQPSTAEENQEVQTASFGTNKAEEKAWQKRLAAAFTKVDCPKIKRKWNNSHYQGPLIDTHIHIAHLPDGSPLENLDLGEEDQPNMGINVTMTDYICMMDTEGTSKVFGFFSVWDPVTEQSIELVKQTMEKYPARFVPFIMPPNHDDSPTGYPTVDAKTLEKMLKIEPGLFKGYGEIGLYERKGGGAKALPPDSKRLTEIYPVVRENKLLVYVHLGEGQKESFEKALKANPDINFIWHGDQLIPYGKNGEQDLQYIEDILNKHPNAYYGVDELYGDTFLIRPEVSKKEFIAHFKDYKPLLKKDLATWKGFIERHPDQVLWGTDRGWSLPWSLDPEVAITLNDYSRTFIKKLDPKVQEKFAYQNAEKLIGNQNIK